MNISLPGPNRISAPPVVMLAGGGEYAVVWASSRRSTGTLVVAANDREQQFHDTATGMLRHNDKLHVVRVAREILDNCDYYRVQSRAMIHNTGYIALRGGRTESRRYSFKGYRGQADIHALFCTDIHGEQKQALANARALRENAGAGPDLIILGGDIPSDGLHSRRSFTKGVLGLAAKLGGSERPVLYARGNHETRGQWAAELARYTGSLYFTADYGPIAFVVLDSGEDKPDDHPEYSGLADFTAYRARQLAWLSGLARSNAKYRAAVCHMHEPEHEWYAQLRRIGVTHLFVGHDHNNASWRHAGICHFEDGGPATASWLTFRGGEIAAASALDGKLHIKHLQLK